MSTLFKIDNFPLLKAYSDSSLYRGDIIRFRYLGKEEMEKKINNDPLLIFSGLDMQNGLIEGCNLMFFNIYYTPDGKTRETKTAAWRNFLSFYENIYWKTRNIGLKRIPYMNFTYDNLPRIFGKMGVELQKYWRKYNVQKIKSLSNIDLDMTKSVLETTSPTFVQSQRI
jgi:hypothetical protein